MDIATLPEDARKLDVPLEAGDIVEIAPRKDAKLEEWKGLTGPVRRFLTKALTRDVKVHTKGQTQAVELKPEFAEFERIGTEPGSGWYVRTGVWGHQPFRAGSLVKPDKNLLNVRITSGDRMRDFSAEEFARVNPWLVNGDHLTVERF